MDRTFDFDDFADKLRELIQRGIVGLDVRPHSEVCLLIRWNGDLKRSDLDWIRLDIIHVLAGF